MNVLLLDLDETLVRYGAGPSPDEACLAAMRAAGVAAPADPALLEALGRERRRIWNDPALQRRERVDMRGAYAGIMTQALGDLGIARPDPLAARAWGEAVMRTILERIELYPSTHDVLRILRARGLRLGLLTNGDGSVQREKLRRCNLAECFDLIQIEGEFGCGKPDPRAYRHALDVLGVAPSEAAMAGDNLEFDVLAPQAIGIAGIWLDHRGAGIPRDAATQPHHVITDLRALPDVVVPRGA